MPQALDFLGYGRPFEWLDEVWDEISRYSTVGQEYFAEIVDAYEERRHASYVKAFKIWDADRSGAVDMEEMATLLKSFGIEPMRHVLTEVMEEVDVNASGDVDESEFFHLMDIIRTREGFSLTDYERLCDAFRCFDRDDSQQIDSQELSSALTYLGHASTPLQVRSVLAEVGVDGSRPLGLYEFTLCLRKIREREIATVKLAMAANDFDGNGTVSTGELRQLLRALGYFPSKEAVADAQAACGLRDSSELDLSTLWHFLQVFRSREGLSRGDVADAQETFARLAGGGQRKAQARRQSGSGIPEIKAEDLDMALRCMGYTFLFDVQRHLVCQIDTDDSGAMDFTQFKKLIRMCWEKEVLRMRATFNDFDPASTGSLSRAAARNALTSIGVVDSRGLPLTLPQEILQPGGAVDIFGFVEVATGQRQLARHFRWGHAGFSQDEVKQLRQVFAEYDKDRSGIIAHREMSALIEAVFPKMAKDAELRPQLLAIIHRIGAEGSGSLDFHCFLRMMQQCRLMEAGERLAKERAAVAEAGFSLQEVAEFRELFLAADLDTMNGELSMTEFKKMLGKVCPMGTRNAELLTLAFHDITSSRQCCCLDGTKDAEHAADFPEFLLLLRRMLDENIGGIRERSAGVGLGKAESKGT